MTEHSLGEAGAEYVIYTVDAESVEYEPTTEWAQELGIISFSLWLRPGDGYEIPIWVQNERGTWLSLKKDVSGPNDEAEPVSDAFVEGVANIVDEEAGDGWGDPTEAAFEAMTEVEKLLWQHIRHAVLEQRPEEALGIVRSCVEAHGDDQEVTEDDA